MKGARKVNRNHKVTQGQKINQAQLPITIPSQKSQRKKEFLTEQPKVNLFFNNIKEIYSQIDKQDKTNNKVLDMIANDIDRHIESLFSSTVNINAQQIKITKQSLNNHLETMNKYKEAINQYTKGIEPTFKDSGINLKNQPTSSILININEYPHKDNFSFYIGADMKEYLSHIDKAIFNILGLRIDFDAKTLEEELQSGDLIVEVNNNNGNHNILFKDANGTVKKSVKSKVSISALY